MKAMTWLEAWFARTGKGVLRMRPQRMIAPGHFDTLPTAGVDFDGALAHDTDGTWFCQPDGLGGFAWIAAGPGPTGPTGPTGATGPTGPTGATGAGITLASASGPASLQLAEDTDNGTNKITVTAPASLAADYTQTLPAVSGTYMASDGGVKSVLTGSTSHNPASTVNGAVFAAAISITGVAAGDICTCGHTSLTVAGWRGYQGLVLSANTVTCVFQNNTGSTQDPSAGTAWASCEDVT